MYLKDLRKRLGLTQQELADKVFVNQKTVSNWEKGLREPDCQTLKNLSIALNCTIENIVNSFIEIQQKALHKKV